MTQPDESPSSWTMARQRIEAVGEFLRSVLLRLAVAALPLLIGGLVVLLAMNLVFPPSWHFSVDARTDTAVLDLPATRETSWRIEGATLCSTEALALPAETNRPAACGGRRWHAHRLPTGSDPILDEQVLVLGAQPPASTGPPAIKVTLTVDADGALQASFRSGGDYGLGVLRLNDRPAEIALGTQINLVWPTEGRLRDLVFPFIAEQLRIGRDIAWSDTSMLRSGRLAVYTGSEQSLAKRALIEQVDLLPGDQVRLSQLRGGSPLQPKGFLRFERNPAEEAPSLAIIAFGGAESVRIERFGDNGYDFRPGWWASIMYDRWLAIWLAITAGLLSLLGGYASCRDMRAPPLGRAWTILRGSWLGEPMPIDEEQR